MGIPTLSTIFVRANDRQNASQFCLGGCDREPNAAIIEHLEPTGWMMENPATGLLKTRGVVRGLPFVTVSYCMYSDGINHRYRKPTALWGGLPAFVPRPMCTRRAPCEYSQSGKHPCSAQRFSHSRPYTQQFTLKELYSMPKALCDEIARAAAALL